MTQRTFDINLPIAQGSNAKWSYISLIFSSFYFFPVLMNFDRYSTLELVLVFVVYISFLVAFFVSAQRVGKQAVLPILMIIFTAALGASIHPGTNALFGYAAFFSSYYYQSKYANLLLAINLIAQIISAISFDLIHVYYLGPAVAVTMSLHVYGHFSRKETINYLKSQAQDQQIENLAAIAERERIARDMHDLLGHSLSSLALKSELAEKLIQKQNFELAKDEIHQVAQLARDTLSEVRQAVTGLKKQSLSSGINQLRTELEHLGFQTDAKVELKGLDAKVESTLFMLCKEWVTNILRHSQGDSVDIVLLQQENQVSLVISDNGKAEKIQAGNGIQGMQTRLQELNGSMSIDVDSGVRLTISVPC